MATKSPLVLASGQTQQLQTADVANIGYPVMGFKNRLMNGDFRVWQRGTSFTAATQYTADRWRVGTNGTLGTRTINQQTLTLAELPWGLKYFVRINSTVAGSSQTNSFYRQRIEAVETLQNTTVTFSFWMKADSSRTITVDMAQIFGTGGSPSSDVNISSQTVNATTSWQRFSLTFVVPSISGKTLGSNNNDYLEVRFYLPLNTTFTLDITGCQLEESQTMTDFERRPFSVEQWLCRRYFQIVGSTLKGSFNETTIWRGNADLYPEMRATPSGSLSTSAPVIQLPGINTFTGSGSTVALAGGGAFTSKGGPLSISGFTGATIQYFSFLDTGTVSFDAEL